MKIAIFIISIFFIIDCDSQEVNKIKAYKNYKRIYDTMFIIKQDNSLAIKKYKSDTTFNYHNHKLNYLKSQLLYKDSIKILTKELKRQQNITLFSDKYFTHQDSVVNYLNHNFNELKSEISLVNDTIKTLKKEIKVANDSNDFGTKQLKKYQLSDVINRIRNEKSSYNFYNKSFEEEKKIQRNSKKKFQVKLNPTHLIINELAVYFENKLINKFSLEYSLGYNYISYPYFFFPRSLIFGYTFDFQNEYESTFHHGYTTRVIPKYYINGSNYLGLELMYRYNYLNNEEIIIDAKSYEQVHFQTRTDKINIYTLSSEYGYSFPEYDNIFTIYLKLGLMYVNGSSAVNKDYWETYHESDNFKPYEQKISKIKFTYNLGVRISLIRIFRK